MSDTTIRQRGLAMPVPVSMSAALCLLIGLALLSKLYLVFVMNVNWDEFFYLSHVYTYLRGDLTNPLQTIHVHAFTWLAAISDNEVEQIIAARLVLYGLALVSCALTYAIARRFLARPAALFAVLCYLAFSLTVEHQMSFRADPFGAVLFLFALAAVLRLNGFWFGPALGGAAIGLAFLVTIKTVFLLPVVLAVLLWRLCFESPWRTGFLRGVVFGVSAAATFGAVFMLHRLSLAVPELNDSAQFMHAVANKVFIWDDPFPRWPFLARSLLEDSVIWGLMAVGCVLLLARLRAGRWDTALMLAFLLPLLSLVIYRNAFPYFYVFILSPAVILCGLAFEALQRHDGGSPIRSPRLWMIGLVAAISVSFGKHVITNAEPQIDAQYELIETVHKLFPEPVSYIDRCSMIASYSKTGFFMSSWGMEAYTARGEPMFERLLRERQPRFMLANTPVLDPTIPRNLFREAGALPLLEADAALLQDNFLPHWGALHVAGKRLDFSAPGALIQFEILIAGPYTLEADGPVTIDGETHQPGDVIAFDQGHHSAVSAAVAAARLRWGDHLERPALPPSSQPIFTGF